MNMKIAGALLAATLLGAGTAWAKLPPPNDEQKAKAEEAKAKAAAANKKAADELTASMDRVAERYIRDMKAKGVTVTPTPLAPPAAAAPAPAPAPAAAVAAVPAKK